MPHLRSLYGPVPERPPQNVHEFLFNWPDFVNAPESTFFIDSFTGRTLSVNEFKELVYDGATALGAPISEGGLALSPNDKVGILSHNCIEFVALIHSTLRIATPFVLLSAYATAYELEHALRLSKTTRLFVHADLLPVALSAARVVGLPEDRIYLLEGHAQGRESLADLRNRVKTRGTAQVTSRTTKDEDLAYIVFSSGTSGLPKAVMISHNNIRTALLQYLIGTTADILADPTIRTRHEGRPVVLAVLPLYHTYGLHSIALRPIFSSSTFVLVPKWDRDFVLNAIPRYRISVLILIPSSIHQLVNSSKTRKTDLSSVKMVASGAAYLPPQLADEMSKITNDVDVHEGYGMSEVTMSATRQAVPGSVGDVQRVKGSCGILMPGMEARIVREDGSEADYNEPGELWLKGKNVALGYYCNEAATKETFLEGGWLRTGDTFKVDTSGALFFVERAKDTLKVAGLQVSPTEIEDALLAHPGKLIIDVCVAGVSGGRTSDEKVPHAWIVLSERGAQIGITGVQRELDAWVQKTLSRYKWLRGGYRAVSEIPKLPTGKVLRRKLQEEFERSYPGRAKL